MNDLIVDAGPYTLSKTWFVDGDPTDVGAVTVTITDANGTAVVEDAAATNDGDGVYTYDLASQATAGLLRVVWTRTDTSASLPADFLEVVRNVLFTEAEARTVTFTGLQTPLSDTSDYSDAEIARVRRLITEQFEDRAGRAWTRRYARVELSGNGGRVVSVLDGHARDVDGNPAGGPGRGRPAKLISVTVGGTAQAVTDFVIDGDQVFYTAGQFTRASVTDPFNVVVEYEYGPDPVPWEANEHGLRMAVATLVPSDVSGWAQTFNSQDGVVNFGAHGLAYPSKTWEWLKHHRPVLIG